MSKTYYFVRLKISWNRDVSKVTWELFGQNSLKQPQSILDKDAYGGHRVETG